jgi:Fur family peroxide stress response transcriptional regulator
MGKTRNPETERRLAYMKATARGAGIKLTHQRFEIFREIAASAEHPDVDTVFRAVQARVPTVSQDTVYRTLWLLRDLGLATTLGPQGDGVRFDANLDQHHHYVCVGCGLVRDFESTDLNALRIPESVNRLGSIVEAHVEVRGLCARCQKSRKALPADAAKPQRKGTMP